MVAIAKANLFFGELCSTPICDSVCSKEQLMNMKLPECGILARNQLKCYLEAIVERIVKLLVNVLDLMALCYDLRLFPVDKNHAPL